MRGVGWGGGWGGGCADNNFTVTGTAPNLRVIIRSIYNSEIRELIYFLHVYR